MKPDLLPILKRHLLSTAPRRAPGFVAAYLSAASEVLPDRLHLTAEAYADVRAKFPALPAARGYTAEETAADAARWPAAAPADPKPAKAVPRPAGPPPYAEWPLAAKALARLSKATDRGLGDVVQRTAAAVGGEGFKVWYKRLTGEDCGCNARRARLNALFPLPTHPGVFTAQHGEDRWLRDNWQRLGLPDRGTFVEVGAADGVTYSNTIWLEREMGWRGLLVEADPRWWDALAKNRPAALVERCAVAATPTVFLGRHPNPFMSGVLRADCPRVEVPAATLTSLLEKHHVARVDLLSIDVEGEELAAWRTLDLSRWRPRVVLVEVETAELPAPNEAEVGRQMAADGYRPLAKLGANRIFLDRR